MPLPGHPFATPRRILVLGLAVVFVVWTISEYRALRQEGQPFNYGAPTPLADDQPMRTAVCAIRHELDELPSPIVDEHIYHDAWTEHK